ncbi:hypothetical protein HOLleu_31402 [Holothuria leucospilota]|uniref:Uncharacterized protein n=1 Tax=Holothuria leucospilota TaxID=206669 RepID=A0A9Q0YQ30_HOLLE|nr:hypothetical protein HOLleu_31402 [Holothuria leucospilota]
MMFSAMLADAFRDGQDGIKIKYRTDNKLFNIRRMQAATKVRENRISDLFADDCALNAINEHNMQLTLQAVQKFTYLGSTLTNAVNIDVEVNNRIAKACAAFGRLHKNVWDRRGIRLTTKLKVYRAVILSTLLYAYETWTIYSRHAKHLNRFHLRYLRKLLQIKWQDKIPDTKVLQQTSLPSIHTLLRKAQVRWAGHVFRMSDNSLPKQLLYGELYSGKRAAGGQKKRFKIV